ncbi:MAG: hypothetical protein BM559_11630 [Roseobacter sp. MedPE-SWchi]|nr:MAG: hypothetical protein BM559_11630 [Roseobacter sp. MedPE-SWchi]
MAAAEAGDVSRNEMLKGIRWPDPFFWLPTARSPIYQMLHRGQTAGLGLLKFVLVDLLRTFCCATV